MPLILQSIYHVINTGNNGKTLTGLTLALSLGSRFLYTGVVWDSFKESENLLFLMASLIQLVRSKIKFHYF